MLAGGTISQTAENNALEPVNNSASSLEGPELPLAMVYSRQDAENLLAEAIPCRAAIAMTANAHAALAGRALNLIVSADLLDDRAHLRIVARTRRMDRAAATLLSRAREIPEITKISLASDLHYMTASALALWILLGRSGPWLIPAANGQWIKIDARLDALRALVAHLHQTAPPVRAWLRLPIFPGLVRALNRLAIRLVGTGRQVAIPGCSYGMAYLTDEIFTRHGKRTIEIRGATGTWRDFVHPFRTLFQAFTGKTVLTAIAAPVRRPEIQTALEILWAALPDPIVRDGLLSYRDEIIGEAMLAPSLADESVELLKLTSVMSTLLNALHWGADAALADAAGRLGIPRFLVSHGSHTPGQTLAADAEQRALADGQLVSPLADVAITQSPYGDALAADMMPALDRRPFRPSMWGYKTLPERPLREQSRQILHAGTYKKLIGLRPWIYETSDEFVNGLLDLINAVDSIGNAHLTIRFRPMAECDLEALQQLLPSSTCYEIKTGGSFLEDLASADLLVSYASTTIEEALNARRPVLLWGGSRRYRHLPAETSMPSGSGRAAVYAAEDGHDLGPLLSAILECHAGSPLNDEELTGHIWPTDTPDAGDLADVIAAAGPQS